MENRQLSTKTDKQANNCKRKTNTQTAERSQTDIHPKEVLKQIDTTDSKQTNFHRGYRKRIDSQRKFQQTGKQTNKDRQTNRQTANRQNTDRQTNRQTTDRQTCTEIGTK